jgi:nucleotide-binding universal stress UspA family protein
MDAHQGSLIRTILVPATGTDADDAVFTAALAVARHLGAHLDFLHVRIDPAEVAAALATDSGAFVTGSVIEWLAGEAAQREESARKTVESFCDRERLVLDAAAGEPQTVSAGWHREIGREGDWVAEYGRASDLLVVGRPVQDGALMLETLEAALFDTGRPLLIPGPAPVVPETIAIAWKSSREAARAVTAAMPLLVKAKRAAILVAAENERIDQESAARLCTTLRRHDLAAEVRHVQLASRGVAQALLAEASEIGAGLMVMGGYGHSRFREFVFGGVTEHVIRAASIPVLMAH